MTEQLNVLLITADDMNWNAVGAFADEVPDVTPNIDRLAGEGVKFRHAHVTVAICQPSRQAMMTGRYPHNSGAPGFDPIQSDVPTLTERLRDAGYLNGIIGKYSHLAPPEKFCWDEHCDRSELAQGRSPRLYAKRVATFCERAKREGRPFFLMANSHDPHRPFHGSDVERERLADDLPNIPPPSRVFEPAEVAVPAFLPDLPDVRLEVCQYYNSCRRCDDTVGAILRALGDAGCADNTLVMFLSDNGMAFPFAKTNCYLHSTRTPWIARWPGVIAPGRDDRDHFIAGVDFAATVLDVCGVDALPHSDGRSFAPVLRGQRDAARSQVFTHINTIASKRAYPMRAVQTARYGYIYNAWSDGECAFRNESMSGLTWPAMLTAAECDEAIAARAHHFTHRCPQELYDFAADPDALNDLADDPACADEMRRLQQLLLAEMQRSDDPLLDRFEGFVAST